MSKITHDKFDSRSGKVFDILPISTKNQLWNDTKTKKIGSFGMLSIGYDQKAELIRQEKREEDASENDSRLICKNSANYRVDNEKREGTISDIEHPLGEDEEQSTNNNQDITLMAPFSKRIISNITTREIIGLSRINDCSTQYQGPTDIDITEKILSLQNLAREYSNNKQFISSIPYYTMAIQHLICCSSSNNDVQETNDEHNQIVILYANRALSLFKMELYEAACHSCIQGLKFLKDYNFNTNNEDLESAILQARIQICLGRSYLKLGHIETARESFQKVIKISQNVCLKDKKEINDTNIVYQKLSLYKTESLSVIKDLVFFQDSLKVIRTLTERVYNDHSSSLDYAQHLNTSLDIALTMTPSSNTLQLQKLQCLQFMNKWSSIIQYCDTLAWSMYYNVNDHECEGDIFSYDLKCFDPVHDVRNLLMQQENNKYEHILYIPSEMLGIYVKACRYDAQHEKCNHILKLLQCMSSFKTRTYYNQWLPMENEKLLQTLTCKAKADKYYQQQHYQKAIDLYKHILTLDRLEKNINQEGGKMHLFLNCNIAVCQTKLRNHLQAIKHCTECLSIDPNFPKALLMRARCYGNARLFEDSKVDYQNWITLVKGEGVSSKGKEEYKMAIEELYDIKMILKCNAYCINNDLQNTVSKLTKSQEKKGKITKSGNKSIRYKNNAITYRTKTTNNSYKRLYNLLNIPEKATQKEIKEAYYLLAKRYHPHKNMNPLALEIFQNLKSAYSILFKVGDNKF